MKPITYLLIASCLLNFVQAQTQKALVIMLDGVRADALEAAKTPHIDRLIQGTWQKDYRGAYASNAQAIFDAAPNSAPNHVAIATGVSAKKHGVFRNGTIASGNFAQYPIVLDLLVEKQPDLKTAFFFCWAEDGAMHKKSPAIRFQHATDKENVQHVSQFLQEDGDVALVYIDEPDHMGHGYNFYPHSAQYIQAIEECDESIGKFLAQIEARPCFDKEDWLIVITADHGGLGGSHGMQGGCAHTVPLVISSKQSQQGRIAGSPSLTDVTPTVMAHMGIDPSAYPFDGVVQGGDIVAEEKAACPLDKNLVYYDDFEEEAQEGQFGQALTLPVAAGSPGLSIPQSEEFLQEGKNLSITMWVKMGVQEGDPAILSNKNWKNGKNKGFCLFADKQIKWNGMSEAGRVDMSCFNIFKEQWFFIALSAGSQGQVEFYQGSPDGTFYFINRAVEELQLNTGMPIYMGQDGTGEYEHSFCGQVDDLAIWNRALGQEEVRKIFQAGQRGKSLRVVLGE